MKYIQNEYLHTIIHGFCNGFFGRDDYNCKYISEIGPNWIIAKDLTTGIPSVAHFRDGWQSNMYELIKEWSEDFHYCHCDGSLSDDPYAIP